ncbi:hypothetical protein MTBLM5_50125 [Magnetospirillum sp. LM-5]|nr:hypothetical protein MTBLM5_50125 [Magnetospirillum sp. LM-5]
MLIYYADAAAIAARGGGRTQKSGALPQSARLLKGRNHADGSQSNQRPINRRVNRHMLGDQR